VDAVAGQVILTAALITGADAQVDGVERRAEVDEERVVALAREHLATA
jgi:hypothetical protein